MVLMKRFGSMFRRWFLDQNEDWIDRISSRFKIMNSGEGIDELNMAGSNDEKISDIMTKYGFIPLRTLKVLSLVNLIFYYRFVNSSQY